MNKVAVLIALAVLTMQEPAAAGDRFSYNQLDLHAGFGLLNSGDTYFGPGLQIGASVEIASHLFAFGSVHTMRYTELHLDDDHFDADWISEEEIVHAPDDDTEHVRRSGYELGAGLNWPLGPRHDLILGVSRMHQHLKRYGGLEHTDDGGTRELIRGDGPNMRFGLRGALFGDRVSMRVIGNIGWLDSDIAITPPFTAARYESRTRRILGVTAGMRAQTSESIGVGIELSAVRFAGDTDFRVQLGARIQLNDRDGPLD